MKGNIMMRLISLMILIPATAAHFTGQIDLTEPTWLWLTIFAGLNAFQSSFTGWCPACKLTDCGDGQCSTGSCATPATKSDSCCAPKDKKASSCCSGESKSNCCSESDKLESTDTKCCTDNSDCIEIKVLGSDTQYSEETTALFESTAKELNVTCCVTRVKETQQITEMGFDAASGIVISGQVVHMGAVPSKSQVTGWLQGTKKDDSPSGCCGSCS